VASNLAGDGHPRRAQAPPDRLKTPEGRKLYGLRKATIEPAIGVIKQVMGSRQFLLRGVRAVKGEWSLVSSAFNLKRMHRLYVSAWTAKGGSPFRPVFRYSNGLSDILFYSARSF